MNTDPNKPEYDPLDPLTAGLLILAAIGLIGFILPLFEALNNTYVH
jgi:preprotein translocase subunit Sss1